MHRVVSRYRVDGQPVVLREGAWHATCQMGRGQATSCALQSWQLGTFTCIAPRLPAQPCLPPTCRQVTVPKVEHGDSPVAWQTPCTTIGAGLQLLCNASSWRPVDRVVATINAQMILRTGPLFGRMWWQVRPALLCTIPVPLHARWRRSHGCLLQCANVPMVGVNVRNPCSSEGNSQRSLHVGSTWSLSWPVLLFTVYLNACVMSYGGSGALHVTRKSCEMSGRWQCLPKCCMLLTKGKVCRSK